ncbi:MAG TPA: PD-(D/E)XK nuclease family protein, partial [Anaeromyxobacter sp.]
MAALCVVASSLAAARGSRRLCDAQGGILLGPQVTTLDRLVPAILAAAGDRRPVLSPLAERLVAVRAGRAAGGPWATLAPEGGLAASLAGSLAELRRGEVDPETARAASADLPRGPASRLGALADALEAHEAALRDLSALDRAGATRAAADAARRGALPGELAELDLLVVDGLASVSAAEWDLLAALASRARRTRFNVPFFPERPDASAFAEPLLRRVEGLHEAAARREIEVALPHLDGDGRAPRIGALLAALGGASPRTPFAPRSGAGEGEGRGASAGAGGLVLAQAGAGEAGEVVEIARALARLAGSGIDPGELAVIAPSPRRIAPALAAACADAGVPFASGRGAPLAEAPVVRAVLDALAAAGAGLDRTHAERLAASTYLSLPPIPGALRALLDRAGALDGRGPPADALRRRAAALEAPSAAGERAALGRAADVLAHLDALIRPLAAGGPVRAHAARVSAFVDVAGIRRRASRGPREVVERDLAALAALEAALDELVRAVSLAGRGAELLGPAELSALTALAVEGAVIAPPPEPAGGAVELWGLDEAPGLSLRAALVTGCTRGAWPPAPRPDPLLREPERQAVNARLRRAALPTAAARRGEAMLQAFSAAAAGREAAVFLWPAPGPAADGGPLSPMVADALVAIGVEPAGPPRDPELAASRTVREALRAAARAGAAVLPALAATPLAARARDALARGEIEAERREAVQARRPSPHAGAIRGSALAALRAVLPEEWSATTLETWAVCPFRFLLGTGLRLEEPPDEALDIEAREEGLLLHAILERLVRARAARNAWPPSGDPADLAEAAAVAREVLVEFERAGRTGDPAVFAGRREAVLARVERVVRAEAEGPRDVAPTLLEHAFGGRSGRPPVVLAAGGERVALRGRLDRVDAGPSRLLVLDYKNSGRSRGRELVKELDPEAFGQTSFQIPLYLVAAARELPGRARIEATYALLRAAERLAPVALEPGDPVLATEAPAEAPGESSRTFAAAVVAAVGTIRRGDLPVASRTCEHCPYGAVCRFPG